MLGSFAVGKTSLVRRFVESIFDERYFTTLGVKIDKKVVELEKQQVTLMLWDLEGQDAYSSLNTSYLRGASGYLLVVDGTRRETLTHAIEIQELVEERLGSVPSLILLNKSDLTGSWELSEEEVVDVCGSDRTLMKTSAKTGSMVDEAFLTLAEQMVMKGNDR